MKAEMKKTFLRVTSMGSILSVEPMSPELHPVAIPQCATNYELSLKTGSAFASGYCNSTDH